MLAYRKCVAVFLIKDGRVFVGQRADTDGAWQLPQGGIDEDEKYLEAAQRELFEEINVRSVQFLISTSNSYRYNFTKEVQRKVLKKYGAMKYFGQEVIFFVFKFLGNDSEINIEVEHKEFSDWKWVTIEELMREIVPFKKNVYQNALDELNQLKDFL